MYKMLLMLTLCLWGITALPVDSKPLTVEGISLVLEHQCPLYMCAAIQGCQEVEMSYFYLEDGTKCSGCPICTKFPEFILEA